MTGRQPYPPAAACPSITSAPTHQPASHRPACGAYHRCLVVLLLLLLRRNHPQQQHQQQLVAVAAGVSTAVLLHVGCLAQGLQQQQLGLLQLH